MNLLDVDFQATFTGAKTSEGDGRTAADLEREMEGCCPAAPCAVCASAEETD